jgi:hypothetical protein
MLEWFRSRSAGTIWSVSKPFTFRFIRLFLTRRSTAGADVLANLDLSWSPMWYSWRRCAGWSGSQLVKCVIQWAQMCWLIWISAGHVCDTAGADVLADLDLSWSPMWYSRRRCACWSGSQLVTYVIQLAQMCWRIWISAGHLCDTAGADVLADLDLSWSHMWYSWRRCAGWSGSQLVTCVIQLAQMCWLIWISAGHLCDKRSIYGVKG